MTMNDDLIARAEHWIEGRYTTPATIPLLQDLLAAVRALQTENERLLGNDNIASPERALQAVRIRAEEAEAQVAALTTERTEAVEALRRLGSSETFTLPFATNRVNQADRELIARMDFARDAVARLAAPKETT